MLEREIERKSKYFAELRGCKCFKMSGFIGMPDRLFISPNGCYWWVEFKTKTGKLSTAQEFIIDNLKYSYNCAVDVIYSFDEFKEKFKIFIKKK